MNTSSQTMHPAEARLARLIQISKTGGISGPKELLPVSYRDVGMNSIKELEETFAQLDEAVRDNKMELAYRLLKKLEPLEKQA